MAPVFHACLPQLILPPAQNPTGGGFQAEPDITPCPPTLLKIPCQNEPQQPHEPAAQQAAASSSGTHGSTEGNEVERTDLHHEQ